MAVATRSSTRANAMAGPPVPAQPVAGSSTIVATKASKRKKGKEVDRSPQKQNHDATPGRGVGLNENEAHRELVTEEVAAKGQERKEARAKNAAGKARAKARVDAAIRGNAEFVVGCSQDALAAEVVADDDEDLDPFPDVGKIRYQYPPQSPLDASDPTWLEQMMAQFRHEYRMVESHIEDSHMIMAQVTKELMLAKAELWEEQQQMSGLLNFIKEAAGPAFLDSLLGRLKNGDGELSAESDLEDSEEETADRKDGKDNVRTHCHSRNAGASNKRRREDDAQDEEDRGRGEPKVRAAYKRRRLEMQAKSREIPLLPDQQPGVNSANGPVEVRRSAMADAASREQINAEGAAPHAAAPADAQLPVPTAGSRRGFVLPPVPYHANGNGLVPYSTNYAVQPVQRGSTGPAQDHIPRQAIADEQVVAIVLALDEEPLTPAGQVDGLSGTHIDRVEERMEEDYAGLEEDMEQGQAANLLDSDEPQDSVEAETPELIEHDEDMSESSSSGNREIWELSLFEYHNYEANRPDDDPADEPDSFAEPPDDPLDPDVPPLVPAHGVSRLRRHDAMIVSDPTGTQVWVTRGISDEEHRRRVRAIMGIALAVERGFFDSRDVPSHASAD